MTCGLPWALEVELAMVIAPPPMLRMPAVAVSLPWARTTSEVAPLVVVTPSKTRTWPSTLASVTPLAIAVGVALGATLIRDPVVRSYDESA